jgi:hypothetical protein
MAVLSIGAIMCRTGSQSEVARAAPVWATPALRTAVDRLDGRPVRDHYARSASVGLFVPKAERHARSSLGRSGL